MDLTPCIKPQEKQQSVYLLSVCWKDSYGLNERDWVLKWMNVKTARDNRGKVHTGAEYSQYCYSLSVVRKKSCPCQKNLLPTSRMSTVSLQRTADYFSWFTFMLCLALQKAKEMYSLSCIVSKRETQQFVICIMVVQPKNIPLHPQGAL